MASYFEHANVTVPDVGAAIRFLMLIDPTFVVRYDSATSSVVDESRDYRWAHVGNDRFYIALEEPHEPDEIRQERRAYKDPGVNHLAWVVDDFEATFKRLEAAGYRQGIDVPPHPHRKRAYFFDESGVEWEILEYLSEKVAENNSYDDL